MREDFLMDAVSHLDTEVIENYHKYKNRLTVRKKRKKTIMKRTAMAACFSMFFLIAVAITILYEPHPEGPPIHYHSGDTVENNKGSLTLLSIDTDAQQATFYFVKKTRSKQYVLMRGFRVTGDFVGEDGIAYQTVKNYDVISQYDRYKSDRRYEVIDDLLIITVNGKQTNALPTEKGTYEIVIDYSRWSEYLDHVNQSIEINGFGLFLLYD